MTISTSQRTRWLTALVLVIAVWLAFWPALNNDFVNYDDGNYIVNNTNIQQGVNWSSLKWAFTSNEWSNWHPLTWISHMIDWQLFGRNPAGHHAVNIALHSLNAVLLLFGLASLTGAWWRSALVAFLFALHPLRVESVAWVAERKDLLSACFGLLAIGCYIRYARALSWRWYVGTLVLTACSLMAKPTLVTMPCILLLLDFWPLGRMKAAWINAQQSAANRPASREGFTRIVLEKLPLMVLAAISSKLTIWAQVAGHSVVSEQVLTMNLRIENAVVSYAVYLWQMIWPNHLAVLYLHPTSWSASMVTVCSCVLFLISGIVMLSRKPSIIVSWFWYLGTLVPVIGIVQVGAQAHADRYTYIPMIGVLVAIIWLIPEMMFHRPLAAFLASLSVALCITLGALTWIQTRHWRSSIALWQHTLQVTTEDNAIAQVCLAAAMVRNGSDPALADAHARKALQLDARYVADHDIYDSSLIQQERYADAIAFLELVIQQLPESAHVHGRLGELYYKTKNL
ncbi:MAG TPA: tetratricopeptide repeat protein, partial [Phycisphaerales bacterium]|nr:tetratricopeptide repeat protein [Phycisphaerales bacterium]